MVLCASKENDDGTQTIEFVDPPAEAEIGERLFGEGLEGVPLSTNQCDKQKAFDKIAPGFRVDEEGVARWNGVRLVDKSGRSCKAPTLKEARIS